MTVDEAGVPGHNWAEPIPDDRSVISEATRYGVERKAVYSDVWKVIRSYDDDVTLVAAVDETGEDFECEPPEGVVSELLKEIPAVWTDGRVTTDTSGFIKEQFRGTWIPVNRTKGLARCWMRICHRATASVPRGFNYCRRGIPQIDKTTNT